MAVLERLLSLLAVLLAAATTIGADQPAAAVEFSNANVDAILKGAQVVFVAFCADWCPFSRRLRPIFEEAAATFKRNRPDAPVAWAIADSVKNADVMDKYFVNKFPTMKVFVNGELIAKEYRSTRSVEALTAFVEQQLATSINDFTSKPDLDSRLDTGKRNVFGYYAQRDSVAYQNFQKVAAILREDCQFWSAKDGALTAAGGNQLVFREPDTGDEQKYTGSFEDYEFVKAWLTDKCIPLVREVTFENVEELTEEGMPFLIFFRDPAQKDQDKVFTEAVVRELYDQKSAVNALLADGHKFAHPLKHLGKTSRDLPVLAIDSFQHMFLFPDMSQLNVAGKLRQFVLDLHSGKLHKEFHETLDQRMVELAKFQAEQAQLEAQENGLDGGPPGIRPGDSTPPPSIFKELRPSESRYSILQKTEL